MSARAPDSARASREGSRSEPNGHDGFDFEQMPASVSETERNGHYEKVAGTITSPILLVTFSFDASKEFVLMGDQILVMPGGGPGLYGGHERGEKGIAGLEGFVGKITEIYG